MTAPTATDPLDPADANAPAATNADTARRQRASAATTTPSSATTPATPTGAGSGSIDTSSASDSVPRISRNSGEPSSGSTKRWRQPRNVREFAAQTNAVATMVLNGDIELDTARLYSAVARTVAQAMSTEVSRSRFLQAEPDLGLPDDVFEETP